MSPRENHTTARPVRIPAEDWEDFGVVVGERYRSQLVREFIAWYLRRPKSPLPSRPPAKVIDDLNASKAIADRLAPRD
jgi:hypothetical protein